MDPMAETFFIADRLRGIPLVSGGRKRETLPQDTPTGEKNKMPTVTTSTSAPQNTVSEPLAALVRQQNRKQGDKRTTRGEPRPIASEKLKVSKVTTTTTPVSLTSKRATTTTTTTTRRPPRSQRLPKQNPPVQNNKYKSSKPPSSTTTTTIKPITVAATKHSKLANEPTRARTMQPMTGREGGSKSNNLIILGGSSVDYSNETKPGDTNQLTRANQSDKVASFGYQRRNPQTVITPRYTNKPNEPRPVGENWIIFNRNDGQMSAFEVIALLSNIMIVSSIVLVILINWFKTFKRKRANSQIPKEDPKKMTESRQQPESIGIGSRPSSGRPLDGSNEQLARSMMGSGLSGTSAINSAKQRPASGEPPKGKDAAGLNNNNQNFANQTSQNDDRFGSAQNISSEFKGGAQAMANNKAMAIVQPTENMDTNSGSLNEKEKLANAIREELKPKVHPTVERSASSLSGAPEQKTGLPNRATALAGSPAGQPKETAANKTTTMNGGRVGALEELFDGGGGGSSDGLKSGDAVGGGEMMKKQLARSSSRLSASSLESTELPAPLVESIKRSDPKDQAHSEAAPSPNLLLGEVDSGVIPKGAPTSAVEAKRETNKQPLCASEPVGGRGAEKGDKVKDGITPSGQQLESKPEQAVEVPKGPPEKQSKGGNLNERPANPMGREEVGGANTSKSQNANESAAQTRVKNHQVVVNKLDKRKTNLEIVDLRDESVTGKMRADAKSDPKSSKNDEAASIEDKPGNWISMDGVAVVQPQNQTQMVASVGQMLAQQQMTATISNQQPTTSQQQQQQQPMMSPSEIIEHRFHVDYGNKRNRSQGKDGEHNESQDSKSERESLGNIENELELINNKLRSRKYFVYIVNDGHFTAKKECIARIELPQKRRITLAEVRQLITNSQDISLSSLRRNKFKFVTETYRLLNENEDAAVLHQVYPTQGVFLKLNVPEQESQAYPYKARSRLSSGSGPGGALAVAAGPSTLSQTTISSRRRAGVAGTRRGPDKLPAIEVDYAQAGSPRSRATSVGRRGTSSTGPATSGPKLPLGSYRRSKSSVQTAARGRGHQRSSAGGGGGLENDKLPSIGRFQVDRRTHPIVDNDGDKKRKQQSVEKLNTLSSAATDLGSKVLSGAKGLFNATFNR